MNDDDWSKIIPLTQIAAISAVKNLYAKGGLEPLEISHLSNKDNEKSPDLLVKKNNNNLFLCEVKTPGHYIDPAMNMYLWKNVYDRLRDRLRKARKQFESHDPAHKLPRIVAFTSNHPQLNYTHCQFNILGAVAIAGNILKDFRASPEFQYTEKNKRQIDMILWCQVNRLTKEIFETEHFINLQSAQIAKVKEISRFLTPSRRYVFEY